MTATPGSAGREESALGIIARMSGRERGQIEPGLDLVGDLGFDSLKAFELVVELEEALGLELAEADIQPIHTVGDVLRALENARPADGT